MNSPLAPPTSRHTTLVILSPLLLALVVGLVAAVIHELRKMQ